MALVCSNRRSQLLQSHTYTHPRESESERASERVCVCQRERARERESAGERETDDDNTNKAVGQDVRVTRRRHHAHILQAKFIDVFLRRCYTLRVILHCVCVCVCVCVRLFVCEDTCVCVRTRVHVRSLQTNHEKQAETENGEEGRAG